MMTEPNDRAGSLNDTEVRFSVRSLLILTAVIAATTSVVAAFIRSFPPNDQLRVALYWGVTAAFLLGLVICHARWRFAAERKAGKVHFLFHRHSYFFPRAPWLAAAAFAAFSLVASLIIGAVMSIGVADKRQWFRLDAILFVLMFATPGIVAVWWRRIRLAEHGIVVRSEFVRWEDCRWYWDACNKDVLVINSSRNGEFGSAAMRIPIEQREPVLALLGEKCRQGSFL